MTTSPSLDLSISSQLIQDYLFLDDPPPPALSERGSLVAIEGGLFAIDGTQVQHYEPDPAAQGGWRRTTIDVPRPGTAADGYIMQIKAFVVPGKDNVGPESLNLLCFYASSGWLAGGGRDAAYAVAWLTRGTDPTWRTAALSTEAAGLLSQVQTVDVFDAGRDKGVFVFGLTTCLLGQTDMQMFLLRQSEGTTATKGSWVVAQQSVSPDFGGVARGLFMTSGDVGGVRDVSFCFAGFMDSGNTDVTWAYPLDVERETGPMPSGKDPVGLIDIPGRLTQLTTIDGESFWRAIAVNEAGDVYRLDMHKSSDAPNQAVQLNQAPGQVPANITAASITRRIGDHVSLFVVADGVLWLTRDIDDVNWVNLGNAVTQFATPGHDTTVFEVFYADATPGATNRLYHLSQDDKASVWKRQTLKTYKNPNYIPPKAYDPKTPDPSAPTEVGTISIELSVRGQQVGQHAGPVQINVITDLWVVLLADGLSYFVGPGHDQQLPVDANGMVTARYQATDLVFPHLTFTATQQGAQNSPTVGCHGDAIDGASTPSTTTVAQRLSGNDTTGRFALTTHSLKSAHLLPGSSDDDKTLECITKLGDFMAKKLANTADDAAPAPPGSTKATQWTFTRQEGGYRCEKTELDAMPDLGSVFDDAADGLNWVKHTTEHFGKIVVTTAEDSVTVAFDAIKVIVKTARQAADAVGTIFAKVMAGLRDLEQVLKDIIEFLKLLFEWSDIVETHNALRVMLEWAINYIPANMPKVTKWVDAQLETFGSDVSKAIDKAEAYLKTNDVTANSFVQQKGLTTPGDDGPTLAGSSYKSHLDNHKSRCKYVFSHSRNHVSQVTTAAGSGTSISDAMTQNFASSAMQGHAQTFQGSLKNLIAPDLSNLFDTSALALLQASKAIVLAAIEGLEAVIDAILGAIAAAATWFGETLDKPIDIPFISWLYSVITEGGTLSILDLFCLVLAVPATVLFKLVQNDEAPFGGGWLAAIKTAFGDPANTNFDALKGVGGAKSLGAAASADLTDFQMRAGGAAAALNLFGGVAMTVADLIAIDNQFLGVDMSNTFQPFVAWCSWALSSLSCTLAAPFTSFTALHDGSFDFVDILKTVLFALEGVPNIGDFICLTVSKTNIMRMYPNAGAYWDAACGLVIWGSACAYVAGAAADKTDNYWDYLNACIPNLNRPFRVFMPGVTQGVVEPYAAAQAFFFALDVATTLGSTVTQFGSAELG